MRERLKEEVVGVRISKARKQHGVKTLTQWVNTPKLECLNFAKTHDVTPFVKCKQM